MVATTRHVSALTIERARASRWGDMVNIVTCLSTQWAFQHLFRVETVHVFGDCGMAKFVFGFAIGYSVGRIVTTKEIAMRNILESLKILLGLSLVPITVFAALGYHTFANEIGYGEILSICLYVAIRLSVLAYRRYAHP